MTQTPATTTITPTGTEFVEQVGGEQFLMDRDYADSVAYVGKIVTDGEGTYLGCIVCEDEITRGSGGCCRACREDMAHADAQAQGLR